MSVNWEDEIPDSVLNEIYDRIAYNQSVVDQATTSSVVIPSTKKTWYSDEFLEKCLSQTLKKYWGYESFRPNQLEVCKCLVKDSRDCFMMMGTGSGKSLVFQLPAIALREQGRKCCTIIISPLISLIEDQVSALLSMNIAACAIGSNCDKKIEDAAMLGFYSLIYATPEKILLWSRGLEKLKSNCEIISIAIDESHCVSEWGSDFRPEYSTLKNLRNWLGNEIPIVALTASATKEVQNEIIRNLSLRDPLVIRDSVNRPNLKYIIRKKCMKTEIIRCILDYRDYQIREFDGNINDFTLAPTLIYVNSKKLTEEIAHELVACQNLKGIRAAFYHSGLSPTDRAAVHRAFLCDDIQVVVATTAFGMGELIFPLDNSFSSLLIFLISFRNQ
jgi:RecQ family ATP-dependent DNA helicase